MLTFQTDRFWLVVLCGMAVLFFFGSAHMRHARQRVWFWGGLLTILLGLGATGCLYLLRLPRGLSGAYYANPTWTGEPVDATRYFEEATPGRRIDRFLDFNPNDFNDRYPFSGKPFSVVWQGSVYLPDQNYRVGVYSNFGTWLYLDDTLIAGQHQLDFGSPEARTYLREGWSHDERWDTDHSVNFVWSDGQRSEFYLGVDLPGEYRLQFRCMPFTYPGRPPQELQIHVNGIPLETRIVLHEGWQTYIVPVPEQALRDKIPGFFRVRFSYASVARPVEVLAQSQDRRQLAVAFDSAEMLLASTPEQTPTLATGFHRITLKTQHNSSNPFLQLVWTRGQAGKTQIIPEDYLFPETQTSPAMAAVTLVRERILLMFVLLWKMGSIIFLGILLARYCFLPWKQALWTRETMYVGMVVGVAFLLRGLLLWEMRTLDPAFDILPAGTDQLNYVFFARGFLRGYWPNLSHEPFYFGPFISFYFILCSMVFGENLLWTRLMTVILTSLSVGFSYSLARQTFSKPVAWLTGLLCACNGVFLFYDTSVLIEPVLTVLNVLMLWLLYRLQKTGEWRVAIAAGVMLGLSALARSNILLFLPLILLWMLLTFPGKSSPKIGWYLVVCTAMALTIAPVTIRNYFASYKHQFVLTTSGGGMNLWIGNNPSASGNFGFDGGLLETTRARMRATGTTFGDEVFHFIRTSPKEYLQLEYEKLQMIWRGYEISNLIPYYIFRPASRILRLPLINFVVIGPLSLVGMLLALKRWQTCSLLYAYVVVQVATMLLFFVLARYRLVMVPVVTIFAAYTIWELVQAGRKQQWRRLGLLLVFVVGCHLLLNYSNAAYLYQNDHGQPMPLIRLLRYWDLFYTP